MMTAMDQLVLDRFEADRERLRAIAYRMLGSMAEADDAVQEAWLRLRSADTQEVENLSGWLTTVVARICLDVLRSRDARREQALHLTPDVDPAVARAAAPATDPEREAMLAEAVGVRLLIILDRLDPAERLAFVLHDLLGMSFHGIAPILARSSVAARQLASRARRPVHAEPFEPSGRLAEHKTIVAAFFAASRDGDHEKLLELLDPDVLLRVNVSPSGAGEVVRGARAVARRAQIGGANAGVAQVLLIDGTVGIAVAPRGRLELALLFTVGDRRVGQIDVITERAQLDGVKLALLEPLTHRPELADSVTLGAPPAS